MKHNGNLTKAQLGTAANGKPRAEEIHRRIAKACIRLERRTIEVKRAKVMVLFIRAVNAYFAEGPRQYVRHLYRQLQWTVFSEGADIYYLPSETTFRRAIRREHIRRGGIDDWHPIAPLTVFEIPRPVTIGEFAAIAMEKFPEFSFAQVVGPNN